MKKIKPLIMIVEDERNIREMYTEKFGGAGFEVKAFEDAARAKNFILRSKRDPECVVLDIIMPGLDGFTFLKELEKMNKKIPVLILSNLDNNFRVFGVKGTLPKGADAYLLKAQVTPSEVVARVKKLIERGGKRK